MFNNRIIVIQADAIEKINPLTDTTLLLAQEAQKRKYQIYWFEPKDLSLIGKKLLAKVIRYCAICTAPTIITLIGLI